MFVLVTAPFLFGLYLLLAGEVSGHECAAGAAVSFLAAALQLLFRHVAEHQLGFGLVSTLRPAFAGAASVPADCVRVAKALAAALVRHQSGAHGFSQHEDAAPESADPRAAGRRAAGTLGRSLAPNGVVLGVENGAYLIHRLARAP